MEGIEEDWRGGSRRTKNSRPPESVRGLQRPVPGPGPGRCMYPGLSDQRLRGLLDCYPRGMGIVCVGSVVGRMRDVGPVRQLQRAEEDSHVATTRSLTPSYAVFRAGLEWRPQRSHLNSAAAGPTPVGFRPAAATSTSRQVSTRSSATSSPAGDSPSSWESQGAWIRLMVREPLTMVEGSETRAQEAYYAYR